jgi:integrase
MSLLIWILLWAAVLLGLALVLEDPPWAFLRAACDVELPACAALQAPRQAQRQAPAPAAAPAAAVSPARAAVPSEREAATALFELLFEERAGCAYAAAGEQMLGWAEAFEAWLAETGKKQRRKKVQEKRESWRRFLKFLQGPPWQASGADVTRWGQALTAEGLRPPTVNSYLCMLSSFYRFCGRRSPELFPQGKAANPAREAHRPAARGYERASCLSAQEVQALLGAVDRGSSLVGKRDYALLLTCLETGWSIGKVRELRWGEEEGEGPRICAQDKAQGGPSPVPYSSFVEAVVEEYLRAAGRWEGMQAGEYVFAPFVDALNRKPSGRREDWNGSKPLSPDQTHFLLKRYARWAGLDVEKVNYHCLRHTAMLLHAQAGKEAESIQAFGGRKSLSKTRGYVKRMRQAADLAAKRGKPDEHGPYQRKPGKAQPGSQLNLRHGMYAKQSPGQETEENTETQPQGRRKRAVARLRWVIRRIYELSEQAQTAKQLAILLEVMGTAVERLWRLSKGARKQGEEGSDARVHEFVRRLEEGQKESREDGEESWPESEETIINLKKWLFEVEQETSIKEEVRMLDEMIERAEKTGREYNRLDEALGLLNAVSQAEMRRERCGGTQGKEQMSADDKLQDMIRRAASQVREELRKGDG